MARNKGKIDRRVSAPFKGSRQYELRCDLSLRATKDGEDLITRCRLATNIFKPADVLVPTLENVAPVYTAVFEFRHQDTGNVKLEVGMTKGFGTDSHYERSHTQWTRIEKSDPTRPSDETASPPLEVSMVRLHRCVVVANYERPKPC